MHCFTQDITGLDFSAYGCKDAHILCVAGPRQTDRRPLAGIDRYRPFAAARANGTPKPTEDDPGEMPGDARCAA